MAQSMIRGSTQILAGSISVDRMVSGWDSNFILRGGTVAFTADQPMGGFKITGLGNPVAATDGVNLQTLQSYQNGVAVKPTVRGVMNTNRALTGAVTNDGVTYITGDVILLVAQTTTSQNGPWTVNTAGAWTRPAWWAAASVQKPSLFYVSEGTTFADTKWTTITDGSITVDTTAISVTQDSSGAAYTAGNGLLLTGQSFSVKIGNGVQLDGSQNVAAKPNATRLVVVDAGGIGIIDGTAAQFIVANASNNAAWATMSGDMTISNAGAATVNHTAGSGFLKYTDFVTMEVPGGAINSSNTAYTLASTPQNTSLELFLNGQLMEAGAGNDYTIAAAAITMLRTPQTGDKLHASYFK